MPIRGRGAGFRCLHRSQERRTLPRTGQGLPERHRYLL
jgi:hypothetical protein